MNNFRKFALPVFVFGAVIFGACAERAGNYSADYNDDNDIAYALPTPAPTPTPVAIPAPTPEPAPTPLPSLAESLVPIGNTFAADGDNIFVIKKDGGLWRYNQNYEPVHILDNAVSIWTGMGTAGRYVHRTDGSLWRWDSSESGPSLFLEDVAYFDGRFSVIKFDGSLWRWSWERIPVHFLDDVIAFSTWLPAGCIYTAITADNRLWGWGSNWPGSVSGCTNQFLLEPVLIMENIAAVSVARCHAATICHDGYLWAWGDNWVDVTGDGIYHDAFTPVRVMGNVVAISADTNSGPNPSANTLAIRADGSLWGWGWCWGWDIGPVRSPVPAQIWDDASQIVRGWRSIFAIASTGELWDLTYEPVMILDRVAAARMGHPRLALDFDGILWTWEGEFDEFGNIPRPFGLSDDPRHMPAQFITGVLLP